MFIRFNRQSWLLVALAVSVLAVTACSTAADSDESANGLQAVSDDAQDGGFDGDAYVAPSEREGAEQTGTSNSAPDAGTGASGGGQLPALLDRKKIMTATLTLETDAVSKRFEDVGNIAAASGGFVSSSSFGNSGEQQTASITIRIPSEGYQRALVELRKLGEVKGEQSGANDVTEEYTDLDSRMRGLRAVEQQYVEFLARAVTIDEVLTVQDRLNSVRVEMEQIQGRINLLANQTDLATITVHLDPPPIVGKPDVDGGSVTPAEAFVNGWEASLAVLGGIAVVALAVLAFSWWLIPVALLAGFIVRRLVRSSGSGRRMTAPEPNTII